MEIPLIAKWAALILASILTVILFFVFLFELGLLNDENLRPYPKSIEKYDSGHKEKNTCLPRD